MDFGVPLSDEELAPCTSAKNYCIQTDVLPAEIEDNIKEFKDKFRGENGSHTDLIDYFDTFFSLIKNWEEFEVEFRLKTATWKLLLDKCLRQHERSLRNYLETVLTAGQHESDEIRREHLNALQMNLFLLCRMAEKFETDWSRASVAEFVPPTPGGKQRKRPAKKAQGREWTDFDWVSHRSVFLDWLVRILDMEVYLDDETRHQAPVKQLWSPPFPDDNFTNMILNCCCKFLENSEVSKGAGKNLLNDVFVVLRILVKDYSRAVVLSTRFMNLLQQHEHLGVNAAGVSVLAEGVEFLLSDDLMGGAASLVPELMRELGNIDSDALSREGCAKAYATFLMTLANKLAPTITPYISSVALLLDTESPTMRNALMTVYVELVIQLYGGEERNEKERKQRDNLLSKVKDHLMDVNAYVRSKSVQLWTKLAEKNAIPLSMLRDGLIDDITSRLHDKSSMVRKNAIHFMTVFLKSNPYKDKLCTDDLKQKLEEVEAEEKDIRDKNPEFSPVRRAENCWSEIEPQVSSAIGSIIEKHLVEDIQMSEEKEHENEDEEMADAQNDPVLKIAESISQTAVQLVKSLSQETQVDPETDIESWPKILYKLLEEKQMKAAADFLLKFWKTMGQRAELGQFDENVLRNNPEEGHQAFMKQIMDLYLHEKVIELSGIDAEEDAELVHEENEFNDQLRRVIRKKNYLKESLEFASNLRRVLPQVSKLFLSAQSTDVVEAANFACTCAEFKVPGSDVAVRRLCGLIWNRDPAIRECVVKAFQRLYLNVERGNYSQVAKNLIDLCTDASASEAASLEQVVCEMMKQDLLSKQALNSLWSHFAQTQHGTTPQESHSALKLLAMAAKCEKSVISSNLEILIEHGLSDRSAQDFSFAADVCYALEKLGQKVDLKSEESIKKDPFRLPMDHELFTKLTNLLKEGLSRFEDNHWTTFMESAVNVIFYLSEHPDKIAKDLIKKAVSEALVALTEATEENFVEIRDKYFVRVLALIGHVGLRTLLYVDVAYCGEMKRQSHMIEMLKSPSRNPKKNRRTTKSVGANKSQNGSMVDSAEEDMGLAGATSDDVEQEHAQRICEEELLCEQDSLLAVCSPFVEFVLDDYRKFSPQVQVAAATALSKLMLISQKYCESRLQSFFTLLLKSPIATVRATLMIAAGDLFFRFPNSVEPWSPHLYDRLHDPEQCVRQNCLFVLTHLILNDMIKVKGHVAIIAQCTIDPRPEMAGLAKRFFTELAQKGNTVYNLMPDIISRLSDPTAQNRVDPEQFQQIMKFLLGFVQKEKLCDSLVEKLCQRFQVSGNDAETVLQWQYLSFCLAQLQYTEKTFQKLKDNLHCFADKLGDKEVYQNFLTVLASAKKTSKSTEIKASIEEFEEEISQLHNTGFEDQEAAERAKLAIKKRTLEARTSRSPRRSFRPPRTLRTTRKRPVIRDDSPEENE